MQVLNPATGEVVASFEEATYDQAARRIDEAVHAFQVWRERPIEDRAQVLRRAGALLRAQAADHAALMAREMGKPIAQGRQEIEKCAWLCEFIAERGPAMLAPRPVETEARRSWVSFQPLGAILAVMPWNF